MVIGRIVTVSPNEDERYYLRLLLSHTRAPTSFRDLLTVNGEATSSYREAAFKLGLLQSDTYIEDTLSDAAAFRMPCSLKTLFAVLLAYCCPSNPRLLWEKYEADLSQDFLRNKDSNYYTPEEVRMSVLHSINKTLEQMEKSVSDYHLVPNGFQLSCDERTTQEIQSERNIPFTEEDLLLSSRLNTGQRHAYDVIMAAVFSSRNSTFFVDGSGGTGKTFLYRALIARVRPHGHIAIAIASCGVAASILPGGRTAHSRFKIPLDVSANKICQISKQSSVARLIALAKLILWDKAPMAKKDTVETFDSLLKDVMDLDKPFGGKIVVFSGDFRQTLPVIPNASRDQQIEASFVNSPLWSTLHKITLSENMPVISDPQYSEFLLRVGEGHEPENEEGKISLSKDMLVPFDNKQASLSRMGDVLLIDDIKPGMKSWTAIITVQEKLNVGSSPSNPTKWKKFILVDSKGAKVQAVLFDYTMQKIGPKLKLYKKYRISNADVRPAAEKFQLDGLEVQWVISTKTVVEEIDEGDSGVLPLHFNFTAYKDLPPYADSKNQTADIIGVVIHASPVIPIHTDSHQSLVQRFCLVNEEMNPIVLSVWNEFTENEGRAISELKDKHPVLICRRLNVVVYNGVALSTRNDSVILVNPPVRETNQLKHWVARNEGSFMTLVNDKIHTKHSSQLFRKPQQRITSIIDVVPTQKISWVKARFSFQHILQKYYYMACVKCHRLTAADSGTTYTCNHCNEKQQASPRCRFDVDLTDSTDTLTASVFGDLAESLLTFTVSQAMEYHKKNAELLLEKVHQELQSKIFVAQLKAATARDAAGHQRYTIVYYFEDDTDTDSAENSVKPNSQNISPDIGEAIPAVETPGKQASSSKVRVRLDIAFERLENMDKDLSENEDAGVTKKTKTC